MDLINRNKKHRNSIHKFDASSRPKKNTQSVMDAGDKWKAIGFTLIVVGMSIVMAGASIVGGGVAIVGIGVLLVARFKYRQL